MPTAKTTDPRAPQVGGTVTEKTTKAGKEFIVDKGEEGEYTVRIAPPVDCFAVWNAGLNAIETVYQGVERDVAERMLIRSYEHQGSHTPDLRLVRIKEVADAPELFKSHDARVKKEADNPPVTTANENLPR